MRLLLALAALGALSGCQTFAPTTAEDPPASVVDSDGSDSPPPPEAEAVAEPTAEPESAEQVAMAAMAEQLATVQTKLDSIAEKLAEAPPPAPRAAANVPGTPIECPPTSELPPAQPMKTLLGTLEWIYMEPPGQLYRARIDSGANTSSISATDVREFQRDGEDWVRFSFDHDGEDPVATIERPVERVVLIRQASAQKRARRPVVLLTVQLGEQVQKTEFTLADRSQMTYPVLLGREFLRDLYLVDVSQSYLHSKPGRKADE
ncbi:MAG: ATP-dependent zinc protease [Xanthomonadales bacterium]|nr:ATP-dependent zinc protease [Xanthomonadales bacterium]